MSKSRDGYEIEGLVEQVIGGDLPAEKELFSRYQEEVAFFVKRGIGKDNPDCDDLIQEILMDFLMNVRKGRYRHELGTLGAFLYSIIKNKVLDYRKGRHFKNRNTFVTLSPETECSEENSPEQEFITKEQSGLLRRAIGNLDEPYKKILWLYGYKQMKIGEISRELGISEQQVSNYKSYALEKLRKMLNN